MLHAYLMNYEYTRMCRTHSAYVTAVMKSTLETRANDAVFVPAETPPQGVHDPYAFTFFIYIKREKGNKREERE